MLSSAIWQVIDDESEDETNNQTLLLQLKEAKQIIALMKQEKEKELAEKAEVERLKQEKELAEKAEAEHLNQEKLVLRYKELSDVYKQKTTERYKLYNNHGWYDIHSEIFKKIESNDEIVLNGTEMALYNGNVSDISGGPEYIITNKNVYKVFYRLDKIVRHPQTGHVESGLLYKISSLYTFESKVSLNDLSLLSSLSSTPKYCNQNTYRLSTMRAMVIGMNTNELDTACFQARKNFETIIRLIPGSYKNGDWKQLDGFYGVYFNPVTKEVMYDGPPPSL